MSDIWYMLQDSDHYLYHYTRTATLTSHILPRGRLRFSRFKNLNDPREAKDWVFNYFSINSSLDIDTKKIQDELNQRLKHSWSVGCFVSDVYEALATKEREDRGEDIIGAMYERGHSHPRMWAQYGENYKGACLVFDKRQLDADIRSTANAKGLVVYADRVKYENPKAVPNLHEPNGLHVSVDDINGLGLHKVVEAKIANHWEELFFLKSRDWEQEREFRWLVQGDRGKDFFVDIRKSLVGIALGDRFPKRRERKVFKYADANEVSLVTMDWKNGFPQLMPIISGRWGR